MKTGIYSDSLAQLPLDGFLDLCASLGIDYVEFGTGNWSPAPHLDLDRLLTSPALREDFLGQIGARGLALSALNCSGNPLHPGEAGARHRQVTRKTLELAAHFGLTRIVTMSGCPAGPGDSHPNWITTSWPPETTRILDWQWREVLLPYWRETVAVARDLGVRLCFEMHGAQCVYNVESFERLRHETDDTVGVNFDPSHLIWMGADAVAAATRLAGSIYHAHAKDARVEAAAAVNSRLDAKPVTPVEGRSWNFVAVGRGQPEAFWRDLLTTLRAGGYDDVLSIENEDYSLEPRAAVEQAVTYLRAMSEGSSPIEAGPGGEGRERPVP